MICSPGNGQNITALTAREPETTQKNTEFPVTWVYFHREPELGRINGQMVESVNKTTTVAVYSKLR